MVNSINSLRLLNTHNTMRTLYGGNTAESDTSRISRSANSLANSAYNSVHSNSKLSILLQGLSSNNASTKAGTAPSAAKPIDNISSSDFMKALNAKLKASSYDPVSGQQSKAMLNALKSGNLSVYDPTKGVAIDAWNPDDKTSKASKPETIERGTWNEFLKEHLKRDGKGALVRTSDGSYLDKATGQNAFFGTINGKYYYATWPSATASEGATPAKTSG
ncbi:hypothetical protein [Rhizobium sp. NPDC090279]|uniref:hypothetical protein n=1 Tax=Rhizobium sp. NPDC090279 TaxID=3364499 RepID=UPI00383B4775